MADTFFEKLTDLCHNLLLDDKNLVGYLKNQRKMSDHTINSYKLGSFPQDLRKLYDNINPVELREKDIIWNADQSQFKLYPLVIPIRNISGVPIAIGCRTLLADDKRKQIGIPKYRNSRYHKTEHLFGLDRAIQSIRNENQVFIVEGYFDAITAHQNGELNVVATCGTMFSEKQLIMLSRYTNRICLLFDNDAAGKKSSKNIMNKFGNYDKDIKLTCQFTPTGFKDLDEYLMKGGDFDIFKK